MATGEAVADAPEPLWTDRELIERAGACISLSPAWLVPLAAVDPQGLSPDEQVALTLVLQRMTAVTEAVALRALASVPSLSCVPDPVVRAAHPEAAARMCPGGPRCDHRWELDELSALTGLPRHVLGRRRSLSWQLADAWPQLRPLLAGGRITVEHLNRFYLATLDAGGQAVAAAVEAFVVLVERQPLVSVERSARVAARVVARHTEPSEATGKARRRLREEAGVTFEPLSDGLAALTLTGETHKLEAVRALLKDHPAITHPDRNDDRTKGQREIDLLVGLCLMGAGHGANTGRGFPDATAGAAAADRDDSRPGVQPAAGWAGTSEAAEPAVGVVITASLETLCGLSNEPGLVGDTIVSAAIIRQWAADPVWARRAVIDADGHVTSVSRRQRFPAGRLKRAVQMRWQRCTFPACNRPARESQIDHSEPFAGGGETSLEKLHPLCHKHHRMRDLPGVHVRLTEDGIAVWRMPSGRTISVPAWDYTVEPGPHDGASDDGRWEPPEMTGLEAMPDAVYAAWVADLLTRDPENRVAAASA